MEMATGGNVIKRTNSHMETTRREVQALPWVDSDIPWERATGSGLRSAVWQWGATSGRRPGRGDSSVKEREGAWRKGRDEPWVFSLLLHLNLHLSLWGVGIYKGPNPQKNFYTFKMLTVNICLIKTPSWWSTVLNNHGVRIMKKNVLTSSTLPVDNVCTYIHVKLLTFHWQHYI